MKYVIFTYDIRMKGEEDEACMTVLLDDDRAAVVKAAYDNRQGSSEIEDILLPVSYTHLTLPTKA